MKYKTQGVCSREISFEVENNKLKNVKFVGGCAGNTPGRGPSGGGHGYRRCNRPYGGN